MPRTLAVSRRLVDDHDDMVVKAMSWALREIAVHNHATQPVRGSGAAGGPDDRNQERGRSERVDRWTETRIGMEIADSHLGHLWGAER